ncbi:MAG TPA: 16S rRNA (cytosine(1402)-N(4))-methyltransferase RsmH [Rectinemataceae bacterium]|nr:16S rRNA (cytosine(1402)-N(4))-methyltransferase RsmH [Rectinemataceae bacterium]
MGIVHVPVMLEEVRSALLPGSGEVRFLDCTLGEGGHAQSFLSSWPGIRYTGIDADPVIQAKARERLAAFGDRVSFRVGYFDEVLESMLDDIENAESADPRRFDRILLDLGISMFHYVESGRGFSLSAKDETLDMRLSPDAPRSAADIVNGEREEELARIIYEYGEERLSRRIARAIVEARRQSPIRTSGRLEEIVFGAVPAAYRHGRIHPATRTFQALRIAVNDELGRAARGIASAARLLAPGGRVAVITFHSLEDRIAKMVFKTLAGKLDLSFAPAEARPIIDGMDRTQGFVLPFKKPLEPSEAEVAANPASRSAKLRLLERVGAAEAAA